MTLKRMEGDGAYCASRLNGNNRLSALPLPPPHPARQILSMTFKRMEGDGAPVTLDPLVAGDTQVGRGP